MVSHPDLSDAYSDDLLDELQNDLSQLAAIDSAFDEMRQRLDHWGCSEAERADVLNLLEEWRQGKRQPHVQLVARIHYGMLRKSFLGGLLQPVPHAGTHIART
jgi:hypothetical protein